MTPIKTLLSNLRHDEPAPSAEDTLQALLELADSQSERNDLITAFRPHLP